MSLATVFRRTAAAFGIALATAAALVPSQAFAQAAGDYRSNATGNWNSNATWQRFDGTSWVAATATPSSTDGAITIRTGNTVTITATVTYDQVTVDAGGQVTIASGVATTLANGAGTDLVVNGTLLNQGGTWTATGTWSVGAGGTYIHNTTSGIATPIAQATFDNASTFVYRGSGTLTPALSTSGRIYGHLTFESTSGTWTAAASGAGTLNVNGDFLIGSGVTFSTTQTGTMTFAGSFTNNGTLTNGTGTQVYTFTGSGKSVAGTGATTFETLNINGGASLTFASAVTLGSTFTTTVTGTAIAAATITNSGTLNVAGTFQLDAGGSLTGGAPVYSGSAALVYNRTATVGAEWGSGGAVGAGVPQNVTVQSGVVTLPAAARTVPGNLTFTGGSASLAGGDLTVNGALALGSSKLTTGAAKVVLPSTGSLTRSSGYVVGNLQKNVGTGSGVARSFEIGDASNYTPVSLTLASVSGAGNLTASTATPGSIAGAAGLSASKFVNRTWTLTNSGTTFTTYDASFTFVSGDVQGSGDPNKFVVAKNTSGTWSKPAVGTRTATSTQATGLAAFSDFALGEPASYTITASAGANGSISPSGAVSVANGGNQTFTITPNAGYLVQDVLVDGGSVGAVTSYPFTSVGADHTISASFVLDPNATVSAVSPGTFVTTTSNATVPVTITRSGTTPILGYSVTLQLTGLTTTPAAITEGAFLSASGASTSYHVVDNGGGSYTVDGVTLGLPCGSSATSGTLFSLSVGSALTGGSGTVTLTSVTLRDCSNATLGSTIGTAATVSVDRSTPAVAVTSPNGGESWLVGSSHAITWTATDTEGIAATGITLEYSVNNGGSWLPVASGLANSGSFSWTVPNNPSTTALVRATAVDLHGNTANDASNATFTIQGTSTTTLASSPNPSVVGQSVTLTATVTPASATGSVEFFDGATSLGTAPLSGGTAALNTSALAAGPHSLTASYLGSVATAGSTSAVQAHTVNPAATTTGLASSPNPSVVGQSVALTATVTVTAPGAGSPGGTVQFFDGATSLGTAPVAAGSAVLNTSALPVGARSLTAVYSGNASFNGSTSAVQAHTVNPAATTTAVASSPNPSVVGQSVAITATVTVTAPGAGSPGGTVQFFDGATSLGTAPVSAGSAVLNTSALAVGAHSLTAVYSGSASFNGSTSAAQAHTVNPAATTTGLASSPDPSVVGQSVALTATVSVTAPGAGSPGGTVQFFDGATSLGTAPVSAGSAVLNTSALAVGAHSLTAVYSGDASFNGSTSAVDGHTVNPASTSTSLTSTPNPSTFGANATLTATITVSPPGAGSPTGTVEFFDGATSLGSATLSGGSAVLNTSALAVGAHSLTAVYSGSASFSGSTSAAHAHSVSAASSSTAVSTSPNPSVVGQSVTVTATITPSSATGSVQFFDGVTSLGTAPVSAGSAAIATAAFAVGSHSITAVYSGDTSFGSSTSPASTHTVNPAATTTTVGSSPNPSVVGQSVTITATVSVNPPGAGAPGGSVEFFDGVTSLGTAPVSAGSASVNTSALAVGTHSLTAVYSGNASFSGSTSAAQNHTVNPASTATALTSAPNPSTFGTSVTLTATVTVSPPGAGSPTGTVQFFDGATSLGSAPLSSGTAVLNTSTLAVGGHSLTAVYSGATSFSGSTSPAHTHTVNTANTTTAVTTSPNPSVVGQGVTITATVTPSTATGTVEFFDGASSLGSSPLSGGVATLGTSSLAVGSHSITATYSGDLTYVTSTSPTHSHTVNPAATSTAVSSSPNPSVVGQSVAITATVTVNAPGAGSPGGTVQFFDGASSLGSAPVASGSAVLNTSALAVGAHSLTAVYSGNASFTGSTSGASSHTVNPAATSTSLASAPNPSTFGASVTLTATVSVSPPGAGAPTGTVQFFDGATSLGSSSLSSGTAVLNTSSLSAGVHSLTAVYSGDASFSGSTSAAHSHSVNPASSSTSLASSPNPSTFAQSVTFTATVTPASATGTVQFFDGVTSLGTSPLVAGTATLNTSALAAGSHSITATYSGDASYSGSTSNLVTQVVNTGSSSVTLVAAPDPGVFQAAVTLTATVTPSGATGSVQFFDGATSLGTSPVSGGTAALGTSSLAVGVHSLTAQYLGDASYAGSTSAPYPLEVKAKIVATAGANGSITPSGTTLYSLNATPAYTFAADPGYHVSSVTVDGGAAPLTSPYTFAPVSSNHTIDVQFVVNPAVPAISTLTATQVRTGNDSDGNTKITLSWTAVPVGSSVEVWRKAYGNYPEYDDGATPGSVPATPGAYPPAGWTLTSVTTPGATDEPGSRDFWYYVAYVTDGFGTRSPVSNQTPGTLSYHLGDVIDGGIPGTGDNQVTTSDLSVLGAHYGITGSAVDAFNYLDVGPTTDLSVSARPMTDNKVNFEDLVMFALNYSPVTSAPLAHAAPAAASRDALVLGAPATVGEGEDVAVRLSFTGTGRVLAISTRLAWDPAVVQPVSYTAGDAVLEQGALVLSAEPGTVDGAMFAGARQGFSGEGEFATVHFRVVKAGDPKFAFATVDARDAQNQTVALATGLAAVTPRTFVTGFAPAMPNPFGRSTTFAFTLARAGRADLEVYSVDGRRVRTITSGVRDAGEYRLEWNGTDDAGRSIAPGVYYARLVTSQGRFTRVVTRLE